MNLNLKKPLAVFDLETTGINIAKDKIVEVSILKISPNGTREQKTLRVNPEMPIPKEVSEIHGITDEMVANEPTFKQIAHELNNFLDNCDLAGYNSNKFDIPLIVEEFLRVDIDFSLKNRRSVDVQTIFHKMEKRTLEAAFKFYCDKTLVDAHSAAADTSATFEILEAQLDRYTDLENDIDYLAQFSTFTRNVDVAGRIVLNDNDEEVFNFGKYKGQRVDDVLKANPGYFGWMQNGDFSLNTKKVLSEIKLRNAFNQ
tara:strand:- start:43659 stop:44429 length:771 start_codon:yes stop_codon:yes gene_type:complete